MQHFIVLFSVLIILTGCKEEPIPVPPPPPPLDVVGSVAVWRTNATGTLAMVKELDSLPFQAPMASADVTFHVDQAQSYQSMDGFGAAMTGSSAYVLMEHMSAQNRKTLLEEMFSIENGIGISYLRLTMGASDFSQNSFTYNDLPSGQEDLAMRNFSLEKEQAYLIPVLKEILAISPDLSIMATPWTAPAWMKDNRSLINGGKLNPAYYDAYAQYFVKYLEEMGSVGIEIKAITIQNEPLHKAGYPTMSMTSQEQKIFIKNHLGPAFSDANLSTQIIIYDHNWDEVQYPLDILSDPEAKRMVHGSAFHCYAGEVSAMSQVHAAHPDRGIYFTECSGGDWSPDFGANLAWNMENIMVGATRNWAETVLFWNLALDENNGPQNGGCKDCRGVVTVNSSSGRVTKNVEYYLLGHMAKLVRPGALRIATPLTRGEGISQVAFKNTDGSLVLVAFNHKDSLQTIQVRQEDNTFVYIIAPGMLASFSWMP
ncbi:MAG: glycoside hydrolase family 30 beta sandwich domain-containing protein [Bacteroidia bacterium]